LKINTKKIGISKLSFLIYSFSKKIKDSKDSKKQKIKKTKDPFPSSQKSKMNHHSKRTPLTTSNNQNQ